jgi:hypothetical protein
MNKPKKLQCDCGLLYVKQGRGVLLKYIETGKKVKVCIHAEIDGVLGDYGVSQEFELNIKKVTIK